MNWLYATARKHLTRRGRARFILFTSNLNSSVRLRFAATKEPPVVTLQPWGEVAGRLLDFDGKPVAKAEIWFQMTRRDQDEAIRTKLYHGLNVQTDADGRFRLVAMFPGFEFQVVANKPGYRSGIGFNKTTLKSGEERDLGERQFADPRETIEKPKAF